MPAREPKARPRLHSPHVERKRRVKRDRILESAVKAFERRGFWGTSMDDIARELNLTRGSLYYYFRDKEEILALCHMTELNAVLAALKRVKAAGVPPDEALRQLIADHVGIMVDEFHGTALALELHALDSKRRQAIVEARDRYERGVREILAEGMRRGLFRPGDPKVAGFALFGAINWMARWYRAGGEASPEEIGREFGEVFLNGLRAPCRRS